MAGEWFCRSQKPLSIRLTSLAAIITSSGPGTIYRLLTTRPSLSHWWCSDRNKWFSKYSPRGNHQSSMFRRNITSGMKNTSILCGDRNGPYQRGTLISGEVLTTSKVHGHYHEKLKEKKKWSDLRDQKTKAIIEFLETETLSMLYEGFLLVYAIRWIVVNRARHAQEFIKPLLLRVFVLKSQFNFSFLLIQVYVVLILCHFTSVSQWRLFIRLFIDHEYNTIQYNTIQYSLFNEGDVITQ